MTNYQLILLELVKASLHSDYPINIHNNIDWNKIYDESEKKNVISVNVPDSALPRKIDIHTFVPKQNKNYYGKGNELFRCLRNLPAIQRRKRSQSILYGMRSGLQSFCTVAA